jgi:TetR/AcrR family transcriptional repressor of nem operon
VGTAARLFLERSYHDVGVEELCIAADVRKGSFYH